MPNNTGWARIRRVLPGAIAYAIDRNGMQVAFDCEPIYHSTGRWVATDGGKRVQLGLVDIGPHFDGVSTLQLAPDYTPDGKQSERAAALKREAESRGFGTDFSPDKRSTDPREKGPDAMPLAPRLPVGAATTGELGKAETEQQQMESMGAEAHPTTNALLPSSQDEKRAEHPTTNDLVCELVDALLDTVEALPKTTRGKLTEVVDKLKVIAAELRGS